MPSISPLIEAGEALLSTRAEICAEPATAGRRGPPVDIKWFRRRQKFRINLEARPTSPPPFAQAAMKKFAYALQSVGPHRDDIEILLLEGRHAVSFASEGQQRSIALAMKLGQARRLAASAGGLPSTLLTMFSASLIPTAATTFVTALPASAQKLVTATNLHWLESTEDAAFFLLRSGRVHLRRADVVIRCGLVSGERTRARAVSGVPPDTSDDR